MTPRGAERESRVCFAPSVTRTARFRTDSRVTAASAAARKSRASRAIQCAHAVSRRVIPRRRAVTTPITTPTFSQRPALIGRQRELAQLQQRFADAVAGQMTVALVSGEPGIGKTRLLDEVAARAHAAGARVLHGAATEAEGMPPYLPFLEALGQHIRAATPDELRAQTGANAPILASLLPELHARLGELPPAHTLAPEQARLRLYEA